MLKNKNKHKASLVNGPKNNEEKSDILYNI